MFKMNSNLNKRARTDLYLLSSKNLTTDPLISYGFRSRRRTSALTSCSANTSSNADKSLNQGADDVELVSVIRNLQSKSIGKLKDRNALAAFSVKICMLHQLYGLVPDNTAVDRNIDRLIKNKKLRKFRLGGSIEDEFVVMFLSDYLHQIQEAKKEFIKDGEYEEHLRKVDVGLFDRFHKLVAEGSYTDVTIAKTSLQKEMQITDEEIKVLIQYGLLVLSSPFSYGFSVRGAGLFMSNFLKGRVEILRMLKRRQYKEILQKQFEEKKIRASVFSHEFHLLDLIGSGRVEIIDTTMGKLIRLTRKGESTIQGLKPGRI
ncbi:uncharacterized protein VTP21DRAFT_2683 [Calcarisporiella thermophila]|uniref:uncharacterized protein n=1 Tax=Calcarisporiella thermophila TaxID=911321 RepID=UPI003742A21D